MQICMPVVPKKFIFKYLSIFLVNWVYHKLYIIQFQIFDTNWLSLIYSIHYIQYTLYTIYIIYNIRLYTVYIIYNIHYILYTLYTIQYTICIIYNIQTIFMEDKIVGFRWSSFLTKHLAKPNLNSCLLTKALVVVVVAVP